MYHYLVDLYSKNQIIISMDSQEAAIFVFSCKIGRKTKNGHPGPEGRRKWKIFPPFNYPRGVLQNPMSNSISKKKNPE